MGSIAVGDVTGKLPFTHAADEMGRLATGNALKKGVRGRFRTSWIPWVTFTNPEVARIGMTEEQAADHGGRVAELPMAEMDRAITDGRTEGFVKLIAGPKPITRNAFGGQMLGATIVALPSRRDDPRDRARHADADVRGAAGADRPRLPDMVVRDSEGRRSVLRRGRGSQGPPGPVNPW